MQDRTTGKIEEFHRQHGYICKDQTRDQVFVNCRSVKRVSPSEWQHNLHPGERLGSKRIILGPREYWAVGVTCLEETRFTPLGEDWEPQGPETPIYVAAVLETLG